MNLSRATRVFHQTGVNWIISSFQSSLAIHCCRDYHTCNGQTHTHTPTCQYYIDDKAAWRSRICLKVCHQGEKMLCYIKQWGCCVWLLAWLFSYKTCTLTRACMYKNCLLLLICQHSQQSRNRMVRDNLWYQNMHKIMQCALFDFYRNVWELAVYVS